MSRSQKGGFRDETESWPEWIDGIETSVDRRVLSLDYEPLPDIVPLAALMENHLGWQIEFKWNHLALIAQVGFSREQARGRVKPTKLDQDCGLTVHRMPVP